MQVRLQNVEVEFVYRGHPVKVKVALVTLTLQIYVLFRLSILNAKPESIPLHLLNISVSFLLEGNQVKANVAMS